MRTFRIRKIGVMSCAMIGCITGAGMGLVISLIYGLIFLLAGAMGAMSDFGGAAGGAELLAGGIGIIALLFFIPIIYGLMGFIGGAIYAFVYNLAAKFTGGLSLDMEDVTIGQITPPGS